MKKTNSGFGLIPAIIVIALAIAAGYGANELVDRGFAPIDAPTQQEPTDQRPSPQLPDTDDTRSYIPGVDPTPRGDDEPTVDEPEPARPNISTEGLHKSCSYSRPCATGQQCVSYEGIAGPNGPTYSTCEIRCTTDADCPGTLSCGNYADGPGYVCSQF